MIEVTLKATQSVADYLQDKETATVRIFLKIGGCGMQSFGVTLETRQPTDLVFEIDGFVYIIEPRLLKKFGPIKIDSDGFSFRISGNGIHPPTGCGTCAFGCGSGGASRCTGVCHSCKTPCPTGQRMRARRKNRNLLPHKNPSPLPAS